MVNPLVQRATSDLLIGPDWANNAEICDILIHDPGQVKDVVKGIKKRIGSKNQKLLETLMNNCGEFVHMHVAERGVLRKMVKIAKRKRNYHIREKILMLIDIWQEALGGPGARYPQYYAAYHSLSRAGAIFPRTSDRRAPIFAPPQTHNLLSYPPNTRDPDHQQERAELSEDSDFRTLSMSEIQNARGLVDVLAEMLNGLEPGNTEGLRQEAIVDLVQQCRTYKQRVVHLINSTSDESLLDQELALNEDLQRLLAKHEAIASGTSAEVEKSQPLQALIDIDDSVVTVEDHNKHSDEKKLSTNPVNQSPPDLLLPETAATDGSSTPLAKVDSGMDLLSGEDNSLPMAENSLAIVSIGEPQSYIHASQQNYNGLSDMLSQNNVSTNSFDPQSTHPSGQVVPSTPQFQNLQGHHDAIYSDENASNMGSLPYQQQHEVLVNGIQGSSYFPPPPWESQSVENQQMVHPHYPQEIQNTQILVTDSHPMHNAIHSHSFGSNQEVSMHNQPLQRNQLVGMHQSLQGGSMMGMVPQGGNIYYQIMHSNLQHPGYGSHAQYIEQRMYGVTMADNTSSSSYPYQVSSSAYMPPSKPSKPEDKLFGDLVNMAKSKPKNSLGTPGST